jgi:hypothetical protein
VFNRIAYRDESCPVIFAFFVRRFIRDVEKQKGIHIVALGEGCIVADNRACQDEIPLPFGRFPKVRPFQLYIAATTNY